MEEDAELEEIFEEERQRDLLHHTKVLKGGFEGAVDDIDQTKISKERLYRIRYKDGDLEHDSASQVVEFMVKEVAEPVASKPVAKNRHLKVLECWRQWRRMLSR